MMTQSSTSGRFSPFAWKRGKSIESVRVSSSYSASDGTARSVPAKKFKADAAAVVLDVADMRIGTNSVICRILAGTGKELGRAGMAFDWSWFRPQEKGTARMPTADELKSMTFQAIAGGANGIIYYGYYVYRKPACSMPFDECFGRAVAAAREVKRHERVFLSAAAGPRVRSETAAVQARSWGDEDGSAWVLVVNTKKSSERAGDAWKLFRRLGADMVIHLGDIGDRNWPYGYSGFRERIEEVWPSSDPTHPREVYVYAWHDYYYYKGDKDRNTPQWQEACELARERLKAPNGLYESFDFRGHSFVVVPQWVDFDRYAQMLQEAAARHPGRPFFVCDHIPPFDTVYNTRIWGDRKRLELLRKYPAAVVLSGHIHQSLRIDTAIWQGDFTVVNSGCLSTWGGNLVGTAPERKKCYHVVVTDVYPSRIEFLRARPLASW